jgi:predicted phage terminase large subunit-like protein
MEEDEQVENFDRRRKFRRWVMRALLPLGRRQCKMRWHGTIMHEDSMLCRIMKDKTWTSKLYRAHRAFDDFRDILWPEMWSEERLRRLRQSYIEQGDAAGYSQEVLNDPFAQDSAYLRKDDFLPLRDEDRLADKRYAIGCDFAVSTNIRANRTSFTVGGQDALNTIQIVDQSDGRWDALEWIDEMFRLQKRYDPSAFFVEDGVIWKSVASSVYREMNVRGIWMNIVPIASTKDKAVRGRALQKRHRAGSMRFDKSASWYEVYEAELLRFTGTGDALEDDRFDSTAILVRGIESMNELEREDFMGEEELDLLYGGPQQQAGRSLVTGY